MSGYNGSGVFVIAGSGLPFVANTTISSTVVNTLDSDLATGLSTAICKDGQTVITANLPMATFRHTGVGNGVARNDYGAMGQVQDGLLNWVAAGGTADAITATYAPALAALVDGQLCYVRASAANATTTPTFAPSGLTAHTITKQGGTALAIGDIPAALAEIILRYNLANTRWELLNPKGPPLSTRQNLTSGSGATYTTPTGVRQLRIRMVGGGGGGGSANTSTTGGAGGAGGFTSFDNAGTNYKANGGSGGSAGVTTGSPNGGAGGTGGSGGTSPNTCSTPGGGGGPGVPASNSSGAQGGLGGSSILGGGASGGAAVAAVANTGGGGGGAQCGASGQFSGGGGGAGEGKEIIINSPAASYTYTIGAAGAAGTGDVAGGAGGTGRIIVDEIY